MAGQAFAQTSWQGEFAHHVRALLECIEGSGTGSGPPPKPATTAELRERARRLHEARRRRAEFFDNSLFGEPAWDILLELYASEAPLLVKAACLAAAVPYATAWRWLQVLEQAGLVARNREGSDGRMVEVRLTPEGRARMHRYAERWL